MDKELSNHGTDYLDLGPNWAGVKGICSLEYANASGVIWGQYLCEFTTIEIIFG